MSKFELIWDASAYLALGVYLAFVWREKWMRR